MKRTDACSSLSPQEMNQKASYACLPFEGKKRGNALNLF